MKGSEVRHMLTRLSFAVVFIGIGIWEIVQPSYWSFYVPSLITGIMSATAFTMLHGIALLVIGSAVLLGAYLRVASLLAVLMMLAILADLVMLFGFTDLIIRDSSVLFIAAALFFDDTKYLRLTK